MVVTLVILMDNIDDVRHAVTISGVWSFDETEINHFQPSMILWILSVQIFIIQLFLQSFSNFLYKLTLQLSKNSIFIQDKI